MFARLSLVALAACGRIGFDPLLDASGEPANRIFVTSTTHAGNFGGQSGGDAICAQRASEAGLGGTFLAWLPGPTNAVERFADSRGWTLVDGTPIADRATDLVTGSVLNPIVLDEAGREARGSYAWTGTRFDGTRAAACLDWTTASPAELGMTGDPTSGGGLTLERYTPGCDVPARLFCLETGHDVAIEVNRMSGRQAFVTAHSWLPNPGGVPDADRLCTTEAQAADLPGTYKAVLSTVAEPAASRFVLTRSPWIRVDGVRLAATATDVFDAPWLATFLDRAADGTRLVDFPRVWGGDPTAMRNDTCANWTERSGITVVGDPLTTSRTSFFSVDSIGCYATSIRLLCLRE